MFRSIDPDRLDRNIIEMIDPQGVILVAGEGENANPMTVSWGHFGVMWNRPVFIVHVRPTRHTYHFMEEGTGFTLNAFPPERKDVLDLCGKKSGRDINKKEALRLDWLPSEKIPVPGILQADLILECRIIYKDTIKPENFLDPALERLYPRKDWHTSYWGEILDVKVKETVPG